MLVLQRGDNICSRREAVIGGTMGKALDVERPHSNRPISVWQQASACEASPSIPQQIFIIVQQPRYFQCTAEALA